MLLIAGSFLLSTIHYDTNFALVSLYMFLLGAGVGMTMQNLVLVVQNTSSPTEIGVASSGVTFFRSLGGTDRRLGHGRRSGHQRSPSWSTVGKDDIADRAAEPRRDRRRSGRRSCSRARSPRSRRCPRRCGSIFEDIYAQGISHSFLIAVPFAVISLIAILFLPNKPLTRMTTSERIQASEADFATVSVPEGMATLTRDRHGHGLPDAATDATPASLRVRPIVLRPMTDTTTPERRAPLRCAPSRRSSASCINRIRRVIADNAERVSPGMLPGAYKVFTTIVRRESGHPVRPRRDRSWPTRARSAARCASWRASG